MNCRNITTGSTYVLVYVASLYIISTFRTRHLVLCCENLKGCDLPSILIIIVWTLTIDNIIILLRSEGETVQEHPRATTKGTLPNRTYVY